ncbi:MAG: hypothetical protein V5A68_00340 [Candidatus Thermoplasmatota archaeon]
MAKKKYKCEECGKTVETSEEQPECCGQPMKQLPLDVCTQPAHPEHARPMRDDEPCDEGRGG